MYEMQVSGEIEAVSWKDGSSGRWTGDIHGLYEGYRTGDPPEQRSTMEVAHGTIALVLNYELQPGFAEMIAPERSENPFAGGKEPFEGVNLTDIQTLMQSVMEGGAPPPFMQGGASPFGEGQSGPPPIFGPGAVQNWTKLELSIDGERSTGLYAGASGTMEVKLPVHKVSGHLIVNTAEGDVYIEFLEWHDNGRLVADLWPNGEKCTGIYRNARGELHFDMGMYIRPFGEMFGAGAGALRGLAKGPYHGTLVLEQEPART